MLMTSVPGAIAYSSAMYGPGSGPIFMDKLSCGGTESSLLECRALAPIGVHQCEHSEDASVFCEGQIFKLNKSIHLRLAYLLH